MRESVCGVVTLEVVPLFGQVLFGQEGAVAAGI